MPRTARGSIRTPAALAASTRSVAELWLDVPLGTVRDPGGGRDTAATAALDQPSLDQVSLHDALDGGSILSQLGTDGLDADSTVRHEREVVAIEFVEAEVVEPK